MNNFFQNINRDDFGSNTPFIYQLIIDIHSTWQFIPQSVLQVQFVERKNLLANIRIVQNCDSEAYM